MSVHSIIFPNYLISTYEKIQEWWQDLNGKQTDLRVQDQSFLNTHPHGVFTIRNTRLLDDALFWSIDDTDYLLQVRALELNTQTEILLAFSAGSELKEYYFSIIQN